jgi:hypothetical protein
LLPDSGDRATTFARDGGAGRVSVPRASALEPTEAITIECWFQPTVTISTLTTLVGYGADSVEPYLLGVEDGLGAYQFFLANSGSTGGAVMTFANTHAAIGVSVHLVATYDRANLRLYVNGELDSSAAATGEIGGYAGSAGLSIGADVDGQRGAEGTIDEVAVYNRALPPERIRAHFAAR